MKFAKELAGESIPEWRRAYINYKGLKKRIKIIEKYRKAQERQAAIELDRAFQNSGQGDPGLGGTELFKPDTAGSTSLSEWRWPWNAAIPQSPTPPRRDSQNAGTPGLVWSSTGRSVHREPSFPHSLIRRLSTRFGNNEEAELARAASHPASIRSSATLSVFEEVLLHASEPERIFFVVLNGELEKVSRFYDEKEQEARGKLDALKIQMQLIAEYGRRMLELSTMDENQDGREYYGNHQGDQRWFHRWQHKQRPPVDQMPVSFHISQHRGSPTGDYTADDHVSYNVARSRLKKALTEFYRSLMFLDSYKNLNEKGFQKILKKFDKTAGWRASQLYTQKMKQYHWVISDDLNAIIKETETLYINEFADGHRRRGMRKLRVPEKQEDYNSTTLRIGFYIGLAIPMLVRALQLGFDPKTAKQLLNVQTNLQIYACFILPILFCMGVAANLIIWQRNRISYKFIFEVDPRDNLDYHQFGELPAMMLLIQSFVMYMDFSQSFGPSIPSELCPLVLFIVFAAIILCPFNILYCSARRWLGVALGRIVLSGCFRVEFRDFFIADELNSLSYSFWTLSYFFCAYSWQWLNLNINCNISLVWYTPLIASLPPWWRLLQCLRRYKDSNEIVHLANALKYLSSVVATITAGIHRMHPSTATSIIWGLSLVINASYTSTWDIKMDWGLLQPHSKYPFLRDDLVFAPGFYYISVVSDVVLRFAWVLNFVNLRIHKDVLVFVLALLEAYRRIQWNVFRLENEHLNNCGQYRAIKEIPLPFALSHKPVDHAESTAEEGRQHSTTATTMPPTPAMPIPIGVCDPIGDRAPTPHTGRDSVYGSFYGRRDFESRHDMEENKEAAAAASSIGALENVLTRIRSFGNNVGPDESDDDEDDDDIDHDDDDDDDIDSSDEGDHRRRSSHINHHHHHAHVL